ncbi:M3 family metallopeptidase [Dyella sp.]|uniref:M3 family metallopeptidase n=1 Tax=Dyella sp. TaxID=1869338 RepID=UPI002ED0554F
MKKILGWAATVLAMAVAPMVHGQARAQSYAIDERAYFKSPDSETAQRAILKAAIDKLSAPGTGDAAGLLAYLRQVEDLLAMAQRHAAYMHLLSARDIDDHAPVDAGNQIADDESRLVTEVRTTLRRWGAAGFESALAREPALARYRYLFWRAERGLPHELPPDQQSVLDQIADPASDALWNAYQQTQRGIDYGTVHTSHGDLDIEKDAKLLARDPDRSVRQQAWERRWDAYETRSGTFASLLLGVVRLGDREAHLQHFDDAPSAAYFGRQFDRHDVDAMLAAASSHADLLRRYQQWRADHVAAVTGLKDIQPWDMGMNEQGYTPPALSYTQMRKLAHEALTPLGKDYIRHFDALLDPSNRRIDLSPELGKRENDSFSISGPGVPAGLFVSRYTGDLSGASVIIHEGGHAMHAQLMDEHGVSPFYRSGTSWMKEAVAILNEFLLRDYLYKHARDPRERAYYLRSLLDDMTLEIFTSAEEGELEQSIYDGVVAGKLRNATDLDALTLKITSRYEIWPARQPRLAHVWMTKRLMYEDPLYLVNYLYAGLLATRMYAMAENNPKDFQQRYTRFLQDGFNDRPEVLLKRFFGKDVRPDELVGDDMMLIERKLDELKGMDVAR